MPRQPQIAAGTLRHHIQVQQKSIQQDAFGQPQDIWTTVLEARAGIEAQTNAERYGNNRYTGTGTYVITLRWPGQAVEIAAGMRVVSGSHTYTILWPDNVNGLNRVLRLTVEELVGDSRA